MKVELEKLKMGHSILSDSVFVGTVIRDGVWRNKIDLTNDFFTCVISRWQGSEEIITDGKNKWKITVEKIT
jgi:hypothetical protein